MKQMNNGDCHSSDCSVKYVEVLLNPEESCLLFRSSITLVKTCWEEQVLDSSPVQSRKLSMYPVSNSAPPSPVPLAASPPWGLLPGVFSILVFLFLFFYFFFGVEPRLHAGFSLGGSPRGTHSADWWNFGERQTTVNWDGNHSTWHRTFNVITWPNNRKK